AAAQQAVADGVDDLAADPHAAALPEEVVDLLHDAAKRVLDGEDGRVDLARGERVECAREGWKADRRRLRKHGDGRPFGVSAGLPLVADACPARMRIHGREILSLPTPWGGQVGTLDSASAPGGRAAPRAGRPGGASGARASPPWRRGRCS